MGNRFLIIYGYPRVHENDPERAINTVLNIKSKVLNRLEDIFASSGISTGEIIISDKGDDIPQIVGDNVNISSRLADMAEEGEILCSESTFLTARDRFEFKKVGDKEIKGKSDKISVYHVVNRRRGEFRKRRFYEEESSFIGRKKELSVFEDYLTGILSGNEGRIVFLLGDAGIGKSRLIEELFSCSLSMSLDNLIDFQWFEGKCNRGVDSVAFQPFLDIMKNYIGGNGELNSKAVEKELKNTIKDDKIINYLMMILGYRERDENVSVDTEKGEVFNSIFKFLMKVSERSPTVYIIDDLYSADSSTLEFLEFLSGRIEKVPFLMIIISRIDANLPFWQVKENMKSMLDDRAVEFILENLSPGESVKLINQLTGDFEIPERIQKKATEFSSGNPFYLEEFVRYYRRKKEVKDVELPHTVRGLIASRLDGIDDNTREVLDEVSIIGNRIDKKILSRITSHLDYLDIHLDKLINASILTDISEGRKEKFNFYHPLYREVAYSRILKNDRKKIHMMTAQAIEEQYKKRIEEFCEELARHYSASGKKDKTLEYSLMAARKLKKRFAYRESLKFFKNAINLLDEGEEKSKVLNEVADVESTIGKNDRAIEHLKEGIEITGSREREIKLLTALGNTYQQVSRYDEAIDYYKKALGMAEDLPTEDKIPVYLGYAWVYYLRGDYKLVEELTGKVIDQVESREMLNARMKNYLARAYNVLASTSGHTGRNDYSFNLYMKALKLYQSLEDKSGVAVIYNNLSGIFSSIGDFLTSINYLKKSLEIETEMGSLLSRAISYYNIGEEYLYLYQLDKAEDYFNKYLYLNGKISNELGKGYGNWGLGRVYMEKENYPRALDYLNESIEMLEKLKAKKIELHVICSLCELLHKMEKREQLKKLLTEYSNELSGSEDPGLISRFHYHQGLLYLLHGKFKEAEEAFSGAIPKAIEGAEYFLRIKIFYQLYQLFSGSGDKIQAEFYLKRARGLIKSVTVFMEKNPEEKKIFMSRPLLRNIQEAPLN